MSKEIRFAVGPDGRPIQVDTLNKNQNRIEFVCNEQFTIELKDPGKSAAIEHVRMGEGGGGVYHSMLDRDEHVILLDLDKGVPGPIDYTVIINGRELDPRVDW